MIQEIARVTGVPATLALDAIRRDGGTQPRTEIDPSIVNEYADEMKAGATFPPVVVFFDGNSYWLADGFHRVDAYREAGIIEIECLVRQGTLDDARWYSFSANQTHGLRRTNEDKRRAVMAALTHPKSAGLSDEQIAIHVGVHRNTVLAYRKEATCTNCASEATLRSGKDGRVIDTAKIGKSTDRTAQPKTTSSVDPKPETAPPSSSPANVVVAPAEHESRVIVPTVIMREQPPAEPIKVVATFSKETSPNAVIRAVVSLPAKDSSEVPKAPDAAPEAIHVPFPAAHLRQQPPVSIASTVELVVKSVVRQLEQRFSAESEMGDAMLFHIIVRLQALRRSS
ncbi:MAG: ParB N-terminal domain-containing protein [Bryobacterales bacterium]|nr:ParB N-terminal domain-containing protein [Bryobacterales bacterium]